MNNAPTQEQIKEFCEWCGFTYFQTNSGWVWVYPDGEIQSIKLPPVDLNNHSSIPGNLGSNKKVIKSE